MIITKDPDVYTPINIKLETHKEYLMLKEMVGVTYYDSLYQAVRQFYPDMKREEVVQFIDTLTKRLKQTEGR